MTPPVAPEDNIGPMYKMLGAIVVITDAAMLLIQANHKHEFNMADGVIQVCVFLMVLALLRPKKLDSAVKSVADKLPGIPYTKD